MTELLIEGAIPFLSVGRLFLLLELSTLIRDALVLSPEGKNGIHSLRS